MDVQKVGCDWFSLVCYVHEHKIFGALHGVSTARDKMDLTKVVPMVRM